MTKTPNKKVRILLCSNVIIHPLEDFIEECLLGYDVEVSVGNFDNVWVDGAKSECDFVFIHNEILNLTKEYSSRFFDPEYSNSVAVHLEGQIKTLGSQMLRKGAPRIISTSLSPFTLGLRRLNPLVSELCHRYDEAMSKISISVLDFGRMLCEFGLKSAISWPSYYRFSAPYEQDFLKLIAHNLAAEIKNHFLGVRKVLAVDLDNTLWGGVLGEDGPENLSVDDMTPKGKCFEEVQRLLTTLRARGIILALCSKNNYEDVEKFFNQCSMPLSLDCFSAKEVNWIDKPQNLKKIAMKLNLGTESLVYLDDSDFEIAGVVGQMPEVLSFQVPAKIFGYPFWLRNELLPAFAFESVTEEDSQRSNYYWAERIRMQFQTKFDNEADFIGSLELSLTMDIEDSHGIKRVAQMTNKTNQFNLTTKRYTEKNISMMLGDNNYLIVSGSAKDRFGESGKTLLAIVDACRTCEPNIDTFLMSCRVIGRGLEFAFINKLLGYLKSEGFAFVTAQFIATSKNAQTAGFYEHVGFDVVNRSPEVITYRFSLTDYEPPYEGKIDVKFNY